MTLEEAIAHAEQQAIRYEKEAKRKHEYGGAFYDAEVQACLICAEQHRQLAEWLRELQAWRKAYDNCVNTDYESIDDSVRRLTIIGQVVNVRNVFADIRRTDNKNG